MWYNVTRSCAHALLILGRRQVVRHQVLVLAFGGSSPSGPAKLCINRLVQSGWAVCLYDLVYCIDTPYLCAYILRRSSAKCVEYKEDVNP